MTKRLASLLVLGLTGLAPATEAGDSRKGTERIITGSSKAEVWKAALSALEAQDVPVVVADFDDGKIRARQHDYLNPRFASCPTLDARRFDPLSPVNLGIRTSPLYRGVDLRVEVTETATGTRLSLDPRYTDVGRDNGLRDFAFQVSCRSTGVLEQVLFAAADDGPDR